MKKIFVIDDLSTNLKIIYNLLKDFYEVIPISSGIDALKMIGEDHIPDLILLDVMMPEMDGFTVCEKLKENPKTSEIPIIFITADNNTDSIVKGFEIGGSDYITKPFRYKELIARINNHLAYKEAKENLQKQTEKLEKLNLELYKKNKEMEYMAKNDFLTGIPNRRFMYELLKSEESRYNREKSIFSIVICDIDDFKNINDVYGHECGDFILKELSKLINEKKRKHDIFSRWGGEEFLFLLPLTDKEHAFMFANHICKEIAEKDFIYNDKKVKVTLTFGISEYSSTIGLDASINNADKALYKGKNTGKNKAVIYEEEN